MYFVEMEASTGELLELRMFPTRIEQLRINRASRSESSWLADVLNREGKRLGLRVEIDEVGVLHLRWN
jgi:poly-gamma-glutamate synthesis protein (capsule biosynthesis protein)